jgi:Ferric uptake regulator family
LIAGVGSRGFFWRPKRFDVRNQLPSVAVREASQRRRAILSVMETASKHLDASQILRQAQKLDASVDRSTVYRTIQLMNRHGLIDELDLMRINEGHYANGGWAGITSTLRACDAARSLSL